jgi:hypothetical protein
VACPVRSYAQYIKANQVIALPSSEMTWPNQTTAKPRRLEGEFSIIGADQRWDATTDWFSLSHSFIAGSLIRHPRPTL